MSLPKVLLISLEKGPFFDAVYAHMFTALRARSDLLEATSGESAVEYFRECFCESIHITAVIVTHPAVLKSKFDKVTSNMKQYAINGGTVVFGALCSHVESTDVLSTFFRLILALPWKFAPFPTTSTFLLNSKLADDRFRHPSVPKTYCMTALYVASPDLKKDQLVYVDSTPELASPSKSLLKLKNVFKPGPITWDGESKKVCEGPVVFGTYGQGHLGWIGDLGAISTDVLIAMCDLNGIVAQGESIRKEYPDRDTGV